MRRRKREQTLGRMLSKQMGCSRRRIEVGDRRLSPVSRKTMGEFIAADKTDELKYRERILECNTFALFFWAGAKRWFLAKGINAAVGMIWTYPTRQREAHAFNFYLLPALYVIYIEPQTDKETILDARVKLVII
jgi:hypothetical protein